MGIPIFELTELLTLCDLMVHIKKFHVETKEKKKTEKLNGLARSWNKVGLTCLTKENSVYM